MAGPASVLVTGSAGRIGRAVVRELSAQGASVRGLDIAPTPDIESLVGSITDAALVRRAMQGVQTLVHLAATDSSTTRMTLGGRRVAVIGSVRDVGTTRTAIALARALSRSSRVVLVDLALSSPNIDVFSNDPSAPGLADLVRGAASFGDIITRDKLSRVHLVAAGRIEGDAAALLESMDLELVRTTTRALRAIRHQLETQLRKAAD